MSIYGFVCQYVLLTQFLNRRNASVFEGAILCYVTHAMRFVSTVDLCRIYATSVRSVYAVVLDRYFSLATEDFCGFELLEFELRESNLSYRLYRFV